MSEKVKFQEIVSNIRSDLKYIQSLQDKLNFSIIPDIAADTFVSRQLAIDTKEWIIDIYLDKFFETDAKVRKFLLDLGINANEVIVRAADELKQNLERVALTLGALMLPRGDKKELQAYKKTYEVFHRWLTQVDLSLHLYSDGFERAVIDANNHMYRTNWSKMKDIKYEDYILAIKRRKYVKARDELEKAKQASKTGQWEEILNHLRPAIDLALKERFGFKDIRHMKSFLEEAEEFGLLPAYEMLYLFFDEGSKRLHKGKIHTPLDCQTAVDYVAKFIDYLAIADISQEKIEEFKQKSRCVE